MESGSGFRLRPSVLKVSSGSKSGGSPTGSNISISTSDQPKEPDSNACLPPATSSPSGCDPEPGDPHQPKEPSVESSSDENNPNTELNAHPELEKSRKSCLRPSVLVVPKTDDTSTAETTEDPSVTGPKDFKFAPLTLTSNSTSCNSSSSASILMTNKLEKPLSSERLTHDESKVNGAEDKGINGKGASSTGSEEDFVFGQNLAERVILPVVTITESGESTENNKEGSEDDDQTVDGPVVERVADGDSDASGSSPSDPVKRKYEAITGEEDESNVLQVHCKLYQWEADSSVWREKGKGFLKLNDKMRDERLCSRLVMRTSGSLKVILNTAVVAGMNFLKSSETSIRFTNIDGIYSVKGKEKDIELLHSAIDYRLREISKRLKTDDSCPPENENEDTTDGRLREAESIPSDPKGSNESELSHEDHQPQAGCFSTIRNQVLQDDTSN